MKRCTNTSRSCPIRCARSVAWFSTAGFHQRSKWITCVARVRLRPNPPAFSERMNAFGSGSALNAAISSSRCAGESDPCRNGKRRPKRSCRCARKRRPIRAYCVNTRQLSPASKIESRSSSRRRTFPPSAASPPSTSADESQISFSSVSSARMRPRRVLRTRRSTSLPRSLRTSATSAISSRNVASAVS